MEHQNPHFEVTSPCCSLKDVGWGSRRASSFWLAHHLHCRGSAGSAEMLIKETVLPQLSEKADKPNTVRASNACGPQHHALSISSMTCALGGQAIHVADAECQVSSSIQASSNSQASAEQANQCLVRVVALNLGHGAADALWQQAGAVPIQVVPTELYQQRLCRQRACGHRQCRLTAFTQVAVSLHPAHRPTAGGIPRL